VNWRITSIIICIGCLIIVSLFLLHNNDNYGTEWAEGYKETDKVMSELTSSMMEFEKYNGHLPSSIEDMREYFSSDEFNKTRMPTFFDPENDYIDAWGTPLIWCKVFGHPKYEQIIISAGPDRKFGTEDDLEQWGWNGSKI
jgi:hypothetical protein